MCKTSSWYLLGALWINAWKERKLNRIALECFPFQADSHFMIATHQLVPGVLQKSFILSSIEVLIPNRRTCSNVRYQLIHIQVRECRQRAHRSKLQFDVLFFLFLTLIFDCFFFTFSHAREDFFFLLFSRLMIKWKLFFKQARKTSSCQCSVQHKKNSSFPMRSFSAHPLGNAFSLRLKKKMLGLNTNKARPKAKRKPFLDDDESNNKNNIQVRKGRRRKIVKPQAKVKSPKRWVAKCVNV